MNALARLRASTSPQLLTSRKKSTFFLTLPLILGATSRSVSSRYPVLIRGDICTESRNSGGITPNTAAFLTNTRQHSHYRHSTVGNNNYNDNNKSMTTEKSNVSGLEDDHDNDDNDWKRVADSVFTNDTRPIIAFDGKCGLCHGMVKFALDHDHKGKFRYVSLQSKVGQSLLLRSNKKVDDLSTFLLVTTHETYIKSDAALRISQQLNGPFLPLLGYLGILVPRPLRNMVYDIIGRNRYNWFGEVPYSCRLKDSRFDDRYIPDPLQVNKNENLALLRQSEKKKD